MVLKSILSYLHEAQGLWIDVWIKTYHWINIERETNALTIYVTLKSLLSLLHKIQRSWMSVWMDDLSLDLYDAY